MSKYIETTIPLARIEEAAIREKAGKRGHPANLHMWWGRSTEASSLAALAAAVTDYAAEEAEDDLLLLARIANGDEDAMKEIRSQWNGQLNRPVVWDAFSGFGGIPLAAQKLGLDTVANDLNPVAALLTRAAVDIPNRFAGRPPVHQGEVQRTGWSGAQGLAEDVRFYGEWMERQAWEQLAAAYPRTEGGEIPLAWIWVRTVRCSNPACRCLVPLGSSYILSKSTAAPYWAEPVDGNGELCFRIHEGDCPKDRESNKISRSGARFRCPKCGEVITDGYIKQMGRAHELGAAMMAVVTNVGGKKVFIAPDDVQSAAANVEMPEDVPPGPIPVNAHWFSPPGFGMTEYADLFTARQLRMLSTFSDLIRPVQDMAARAALEAGMGDVGDSLENGGTGALAYGEAVGLYLAFVVDKMADYNSSICSWRTAGGSIRSTFGRQSIPMVWTFAEGNPFSHGSGSFQSMLASVADSIGTLGRGRPAVVFQDNAITMEHPRHVLVCTELPYYRDIGYADLSDFFYIWLRRSLKETYPGMFHSMVTPREELSTVCSYYGVSNEAAENTYRADMKTVCEKLYASSSDAYPALLFYRFRKNDLECMKGESVGAEPSAWECMLDTLLSVGFSLTAVWPMRSEPVSDKADSIRVLIVARKGMERRGTIARRGFIHALKRELPGKWQTLRAGQMRPEDELLAGIGQGLSVFSAFDLVMNADGSAMSVHDALQIICQECENQIEERTAAAADGAADIKEE